jgi:tricorn protease
MRYLTIALFTLASALPAASETKLLRYPDISRDSVVFVYAGDLWTAPRAGGSARRLTSAPGSEIFPKFSPDGQWIAFTGQYDGNDDVYVIPANGGEPRRLTFHPASDNVLGWTPDSKSILFRSNRGGGGGPMISRLYTIPLEGGMEQMLPIPRASLTSFSPDGSKIAYNPTSQEFRTWKRYRGGWFNYIGIYDLKKNTYEELPRSGALDQFPMWSGNAIYYISDREGTMNLYRYDMEVKRNAKLTSYSEYDIKWPSLNAGAIVYENGGTLHVLDLKPGSKPKDIAIEVAGDLITTRPDIKTVTNGVRSFAISPGGVRAVVEARGDILTVPAEKGAIRNLTDSPGVHERDAVWSPDGKWIAYFSDRSGDFELYLRPQLGGDEVRITTDGNCYRFEPFWSPDSKKLAWWDKTLRLSWVDIDQKQTIVADVAQVGGFGGNTHVSWSPDSKWLAYTKQGDNFNPAVHLYSLDQKKATRVTDGFYGDGDPVFDPSGKYLFFPSSRFFYPSSGNFDQRFNYYNSDGIFALVLKKGEASPFAPQSDDEKDSAKKDDTKKDEPKSDDVKKEEAAKDEKKPDEPKAAAKPEPVKPTEIDLDGLGSRIAFVPIASGNFEHVEARKGKLFYISRPIDVTLAGRPGQQPPSGTLHVYDLEKREDKVVIQGIDNYDLDKNGTKMLYKAGNDFGITEAQPGKKPGDGKLNLAALQVRVEPREEWKEIFHEAWRIERDFYWDPAMGGTDWKKIGARYEALLPWVAHRDDLNYIIGEMIAELSTSHTYVGGGDIPQARRIGVGLLGVDFAADQGFYKLAKIYRGENWDPQTRSPLTEPGLKVKEGDYLIAVDGAAVRAPANPYSFFQNLAGRVVTLKINDKPSADGAWEISVQTVASENGLRYYNWVESRREIVRAATGGRVAYMHVPNTSIAGIQAFDKYMQAQNGMDALVVDERYNGGGNIPDFFTEKLGRRMLNLVAPREGRDVPWPPAGITGPKVMIVNELAGSGGDAFPWYFQQQKIGPVVGTRTWGGLVGISRGIPMMDGGGVTAPEFAFWALEKGTGKWIVENHGVDPDYLVEQRPDLEVSGHDPQLEKAIELIKEQLKNYPPLPARPKYPDKTKLEAGR